MKEGKKRGANKTSRGQDIRQEGNKTRRQQDKKTRRQEGKRTGRQHGRTNLWGLSAKRCRERWGNGCFPVARALL
jgi:hypothetical protein